MSKAPFISVVMPIYNVEKHLKKAIDSVLNQTFQDFEIILVDDCSPDGCPAICDEYEKKYDEVSVIHHKENKGLSQARNSGIAVAKGKYIWFMDSDDFVDEYLFQKVYDSTLKNPADVIVFGLVEEYYDKNDTLHHTREVSLQEELLCSQTDVRKRIIDLEKMTMYGYAWNKFFSLDIIKKYGYAYRTVRLIEDIWFSVDYCMDISTMNILGCTPYHYNRRMDDNSLTSKFVPEYFKVHRKRVKLVYDQYVYWNMCDERVKTILANIYTRYIYSALERNCDERSDMNHKNRRMWVKKLFADEFFAELMPYAKGDSILLKIMQLPLKKRMSVASLTLSRCIYIVKNKLPMLFSVVKQNR